MELQRLASLLEFGNFGQDNYGNNMKSIRECLGALPHNFRVSLTVPSNSAEGGVETKDMCLKEALRNIAKAIQNDDHVAYYENRLRGLFATQLLEKNRDLIGCYAFGMNELRGRAVQEMIPRCLQRLLLEIEKICEIYTEESLDDIEEALGCLYR